MAPRRPSLGRQKIEIRRIESDEARQVCFSKRRAGLFKKASDLSTLCGADVAAVVFSPAGKAFSFGHPSVESILERFLAAPSPISSSTCGGGGGGDCVVSELNRQYGELRAMLDVEKARQERAEEAARRERAAGSPAMAWLDVDLRAVARHDLAAFEAALLGVHEAVRASADQVLRDAFFAARRARQTAQFPGAQSSPGFPVAADPQGFGQAILGPSF
jgi:hypothetical protein